MKLALKLSTPPLPNNSTPENFGSRWDNESLPSWLAWFFWLTCHTIEKFKFCSDDDDEIQLTGRGNLRGLTQKYPANALDAETKIHKRESDPEIDRTAAPSLGSGRSV